MSDLSGYAAVSAIREFLAFYPDRVDTIEVGVEDWAGRPRRSHLLGQEHDPPGSPAPSRHTPRGEVDGI